MFDGFVNNCIFPENLIPPAFHKASSETRYSKGFQKIITKKIVIYQNPYFLQMLAPCGFGAINHFHKSEYFFCRELNPYNFDSITKTL